MTFSDDIWTHGSQCGEPDCVLHDFGFDGSAFGGQNFAVDTEELRPVDGDLSALMVGKNFFLLNLTIVFTD